MIRRGLIAGSIVALLAWAASALAATNAPPPGRFTGSGGSFTVSRAHNKLTGLHFKATVRRSNSQCSGHTPGLGSITISIPSTLRISRTRVNGYPQYVVGTGNLHAYEHIASVKVSYALSHGGTTRGTAQIVFDFDNPGFAELYAALDGCSFYNVGFIHR